MYWVDLERGGHPLRVELFQKGPTLTSRTFDVKLRTFKLPDGKDVWFPISAVREHYNWGETHYPDDKAVFREAYFLSSDSLVFNQGLADSTFSVRSKRDEPKLAGLAIRKQYSDLQAHPKERPRTDKKSVEEQLDRRLAEADKQAKMIEATSPARQGWGAMQALQVVLNVVGIALLVGLLVHRMRAKG